ncbi:class I adenylate-forming enzyme family protein [Blastopirellula retiformator]|uniref:class I adenylate-forming enzyme family protein n=1 Tax=Blastopirellula retiformator TaxID=2527970 RepID=UPI001644892D|nr:class I adenylate-forming enzyme family protein [Blastopirellula retiformator]
MVSDAPRNDATRLQSMFEKIAQATPDQMALRHGGSQLSYQQLDIATKTVAAGLRGLGVAPGDRVAWLMPNCVEAVVVTLACYQIGAIAMPLNYRYVTREVEEILARTTARLLVYHVDKRSVVQPLADSATQLVEVAGDGSVSLPFDRLLAAKADNEVASVAEADPALILFTSGSTGRPKGVVHSHGGVYSAIAQSRELFDFQPSDVVLVGKPISHAGGLHTQMFAAMLAGAEVILTMKPTPQQAVAAINQDGVTEYGMLASDLLDFVEYLEQHPTPLPSLKNAIGSGDAVPSDLHHRFRDLLNWEVMEGAGMTEVGCYYAGNPRYGKRKWGSLGIAAPGMQLRVVDASGQDCPAGEQGEIVLQTPSATIGYWNDEVATEALFQNGFLHTGDLAYRDDDGYVWFVGRQKLMIIRRGSNIAPAEVENIIDEHPLVHASVVVGVADPQDGQVPVACVALVDGADASAEASIRDYVNQHLAEYKNPVRYLFLPELPRNATGKFDRRQLAELAQTQRPDGN